MCEYCGGLGHRGTVQCNYWNMNSGFRMPGFETKLHLLLSVCPRHIIQFLLLKNDNYIINSCLLELL